MTGFKRRAAVPLLLAALAGCATAPITGREQFILVSDSEANQMGAQAYQEILNKGRVSRDPQMNAIVARVSQRLAGVVDVPGAQWQYTVFDDATPNAFALPGGKIGVNAGMFRVARTEGQIAAVISHEIGHVMARHSAERMSREVAVQVGIGLLGAATNTAQYAEVMAQAATLGLILPFTREQESEADEIGLIHMARAGYDPREAIALWQNMEAAAGGRGPIEFLSTHPSPGNRIARLQQAMPRALADYNSSPLRGR
jgi:predicted Zn-dependent protease